MMSLRIGGSTFSYMWTTQAAAAIERLCALGLNDFDVIMAPGHLWPDDMTASDRRQLRDELERSGTRLESLNPPAIDYNLASPVADVREHAVALYTKTLHLAADLGAKGVVVVPGRVSSLWPPLRETVIEGLCGSIEALLAVSRQLGLALHVETHPLTPIPTADDMISFVDRFGDPAMGIAYDVANAEFIGENQPDAIERMGKRLSQLHLSDGTRSAWRHDPLGSGSVDFRAIMAAVDRIGFSGVAVLELISKDPEPAFKTGKAEIDRLIGETNR
ncbi:sugar phosphate isomerase/epimerase family protein [Pseudochelatococcus sp. B33]